MNKKCSALFFMPPVYPRQPRCRWIFLALGMIAFSMLCSCASTVRTTVTRPAEFDLHGARTIAVLPFQVSGSYNVDSTGFLVTDIMRFVSAINNSGDPDEAEVANYLTGQLLSKLSASSYITLVGSAKVEQALSLGTQPPVDAYVTGQITRFRHHTNERREKVELEEGKYRYDLYYTRTVEMDVLYQIIDAKTNRVMATRTRSCSGTSGEVRHKHQLSRPLEIIRHRIDGMVAGIMREMQPYEESVTLKLLKSKSRNVRMQLADEYVEAGQIDLALEQYRTVYDEQKLFEAGYNAAILMQASGNLTDSRAFMGELATNTGDKRAIKALSNLDYEISQAERLKKQLSQEQ